MQRLHRPPLAAILVVPLVAALVLTLFAWPSARIGPRDLPVGVAGPAGARLAAAGGAFDVHRYADEAAAREAIEEREVYGALARGPKVLIASAASRPSPRCSPTPPTARPSRTSSRPRRPRSALAASVLPLVLAGVLTGLVASLLAAGALAPHGADAHRHVLTGLAAPLIVQSWLDVVGGDWCANGAALSLTVLAIAATVSGLHALLGKAGVAVGALTMVFVGNPFSGVASSPEMLPPAAGTLGQLLPPGAGGNLLRSTGFFDGAAAGEHLVVLAPGRSPGSR